MAKLKLYGNRKSGNVYKVTLALRQLGLPYEEIQIGLGPGTESQSPEFLAINPLGQVPVLEIQKGQFIYQSNAILWYLAQTTALLPKEQYAQARVMQWLCFEQYELEPNLAWARWICFLMEQAQQRKEDLAGYHQGGYRALDMINEQLTHSDFITAGDYSIADLALYAYIHNCEQGHFSLQAYPAIRSWLTRVEAVDGFFPMSEQFSQFDY